MAHQLLFKISTISNAVNKMLYCLGCFNFSFKNHFSYSEIIFKPWYLWITSISSSGLPIVSAGSKTNHINCKTAYSRTGLEKGFKNKWTRKILITFLRWLPLKLICFINVLRYFIKILKAAASKYSSGRVYWLTPINI